MALNSIIRTNMTAVNAHRQLSGAGLKQTTASERLASGQRINSAADDVAGLGIAQKMRSQIVSMDRASLNAQDGMSLVQTAEGALSGVNEMLIRARELLVKAANDTNVHDEAFRNQSDRVSIQDELDQIMFEINNVAYRTEFNTRTLLDGSLHQDGIVHGTHEWVDEVRVVTPANITTLDQFLRTTANPPFNGSFAELINRIGVYTDTREIQDWIAINGNFSGLEDAINNSMVNSWDNLEIIAGLRFRDAQHLLDSFIAGSDSVHNNWADFVADPDNANLTASTFSRMNSRTGGVPIYEALRMSGFMGLTPESHFSEVRNVFYQLGSGWGTGIPAAAIEAALSDRSVMDPTWLEVRGGDNYTWANFVQDNLTAATEIVEHQVWAPNEAERQRGTALWFQIGANSGQGMTVAIGSMTTRSLGDPLGDLMDLIDVENPRGRPISEQIDIIDSALNRVNRQRAELGAVHNRLEFAQLGLDVSSENLTAAMSRIRDADMAKEMMNFYAANVLTQAATAMIAHANQAPQAVLELLQ